MSPFDPARPWDVLPNESILPTNGHIRSTAEAFEVEEIPLYPCSGEGEWWFAWVQKRGRTTPDVAQELARALDVNPQGVGWAGYKDRHAVTRQWLCFPGLRGVPSPEGIRGDGFEVLRAVRHGNKLRRGHLVGNRFKIRVEGIETSVSAVATHLQQATQDGIPNSFGAQRFGMEGRNHLYGQGLISGDWESLVELCGTDHERDLEPMTRAREAVRGGDFERARREFPRGAATERTLVASRTVRQFSQRLDRKLRDLLLSAFQSAAFNQVLARRLGMGQRVLSGDVFMKRPKGRPFVVTDLAQVEESLQTGQIVATGPLPGPKMPLPEGEAALIESSVLSAFANWDTPLGVPPGACEGIRRPFFVFPDDLEVREVEPGVAEIVFSLPAGSYATAVLGLLGVKDPTRDG